MATKRRKRAKRRAEHDEPNEQTESDAALDEALNADPFEDTGPPDFGDLLSPPAMKMTQMAAKGVDTVPDKIRVSKFLGNRWVRKQGVYPPGGLTVARLESLWGPGRYALEVANATGQYLWRQQVDVGDFDPVKELEQIAGVRPREAAAAAAPVASSSGDRIAYLLEQQSRMLERVIDRLGQAAAPPQDPLRDSMAGMARMIQLQMLAASKMQMQPETRRNGDGMDAQMFKLLADALNRQATPPAAASPDLELLRLGLGLGAQLMGAGKGAAAGKDGEAEWFKIIPDIVDSVGVPLIITLAQAVLPPDKAATVAEVMKEHARAGEPANDEEPIETSGHEAAPH